MATTTPITHTKTLTCTNSKKSACSFTINGFDTLGNFIVGNILDSSKLQLDTINYYRMLALKQYELSNHLGNVLAVVSDKKTPVISGNNITRYTADVTNATLYYPFGSVLKTLTSTNTTNNLRSNYLFGFNGKEDDDEVSGDGNWQDYGLRMYSTRLGRFPNPDPLIKQYPWYTPYQFSGNNPIRFIDLDGGEPKDPPGMWLSNPGSKDYGDHYGKGGTLTLVNDKETEAKFYVYQQRGINGGSDFHWYNQDTKKWLPFTPTGYVEQGSWQNTEQGQDNFAAFQRAIKSNQGMLNFAAGFATAAASLSTGGFSGASTSLLKAAALDRLSAGLSDMSVQLLSGKTFGHDYNFTSTIANIALPNASFASAAMGSFGEYNAKEGFTLGNSKSFGRATFETGVNTLGNLGAAKLGDYSLSVNRAMPKYEQFGFKTLANTLGNSKSTAVTEIK